MWVGVHPKSIFMSRDICENSLDSGWHKKLFFTSSQLLNQGFPRDDNVDYACLNIGANHSIVALVKNVCEHVKGMTYTNPYNTKVNWKWLFTLLTCNMPMEIHLHSHHHYFFPIISTFKTSPSKLKRMEKQIIKLVLPKVIEQHTENKNLGPKKTHHIQRL